MASQIFGPSAVVSVLNRALTNTSTSNAVFNNQVEQAGTTDASQLAFAQVFGAPFAVGKTAADLSALLMKNMGLDNALLAAALTDYIAANGTKNVGIIAYQLSSLLSNLENDAVYGASAKAWNSEVTAAYEYSANPLNTTSTTVEADGSATGKTFTLTTGVDTLPGTSGNDTFIADNTGSASTPAVIQASVADTINGGAGVDTFKLFLNAATTSVSAATLPTLNSVENIAINGGALTSVNVSTIAGVTGVALDSTVQTVTGTTAGTTNTVTVAGQAVTLSNTAAAIAATTSTSTDAAPTAITAKAAADLVTSAKNFTTVIASAADTAANVTLSKVASATHVNTNTNTTGGASLVQTTSYTDTQTLDIAGTKVVTLNLTSTGAANAIILANAGAALKTLNIAGDKAVTISGAGADALTTINASTDTAAVTVDVSGAARAAAFAFTGGAGNDKLTLAAGDLALLTSGAQLNGGAGTDTLVIKDVTPAYAALNKAVGFEVLGLGVTGTTVDAAQLTSIKSFSIGVAASTETINNLGAGSSVAITAATTAVNLGAALGNTATDISIGSATAAGFTTTSLTTTGLTAVGLTVNGASLQTITTLGNSDNTTLTIKGAADLTITNALAGTTTGSTVDASALTGKLTVTGSGKSDIIIGGSGDDVLSGGAGAIADTLTGGAGKDLFKIVAGVTAATADVITDFATKVDTITFGGATGAAANFKAGLAAVASFDAALAAAEAIFADTTTAYVAQQVGTDTYVFYAAAADSTTAQIVKLVGVDLAHIAAIDFVA